jgi:hypothetical protein
VHPSSFAAWPSQHWLAERLGIGIRTVRRAVADIVKAGWYTVEMHGRSWRYIPNETRWQNGGRMPIKVAHTGKKCSSAADHGSAGADNLRQLSDRREPNSLADCGLRHFARKQGAFVFEGSEPWKAWCNYRKRNGLPASLPTRQAMIGGRLRSGWDLPTLWPPGDGPDQSLDPRRTFDVD